MLAYRGSQPVRITATQTDSAAATTTSTNAAMPVVTGKAQWAVGGVAVALALAVV